MLLIGSVGVPKTQKTARTVKHPARRWRYHCRDERAMKPETLESYMERLLKVLVHIQNHLDEELSLGELAAVAHFSPYHFHRIFRGMVGESVREHVRRLRLERAALRLKHGREPVTGVAFDAGYESHEAFTRAFTVLFRVPPSVYRRNNRSLSLPPVPSGVHYAPNGAVAALHPYVGGEPMDVRVETLQAKRVAFIRHTGPYREVGSTFGRLFAWAGQRGYLSPQSVFLGLAHDDPDVTPPEKLRYDACMVVDEQFAGEGEVGVQEIAGGDYAVTVHRGPYYRVAETIARLCGEWAPRSGREIRSMPTFGIFLNDPSGTAPEELLTEICLPLEPPSPQRLAGA
jgi:AraC family transcriptional regulator